MGVFRIYQTERKPDPWSRFHQNVFLSGEEDPNQVATCRCVQHPAAIVLDGKVFLLTRCEDNPAAHLGGPHFAHRAGIEYRRNSFRLLPNPSIIS